MFKYYNSEAGYGLSQNPNTHKPFLSGMLTLVITKTTYKQYSPHLFDAS